MGRVNSSELIVDTGKGLCLMIQNFHNFILFFIVFALDTGFALGINHDNPVALSQFPYLK